MEENPCTMKKTDATLSEKDAKSPFGEIRGTDYSEKQMAIINGSLSMEDVSGHVLTHLYKRALANQDDVLAEATRLCLNRKKAENKKRSNRASRKRIFQMKKGANIEWKQPRSNNYTEHQKQIVRSEIPYEKVHTNELVSLYQKAHSNKDIELAERIYDIIRTRRLDLRDQAEKRADAQAKKYAAEHPAECLERKRGYHKKYTDFREKADRFDELWGCDEDIPLSNQDKAVLLEFCLLDEYDEEQLALAMTAVIELGDERLSLMIEAAAEAWRDSHSLYSVKSHEEAIDLIEELLGLPIRRPETWFID